MFHRESQEENGLIQNHRYTSLQNNIISDLRANTNKFTLFGRRIRKICWEVKSSHKAIFGCVLFITIVMIVAILTISFTASKKSRSCQLQFKALISDGLFQHDSHPRSLATGDVNHDNLLDFIVVNFGTNTIGVYLNYGNRTFASLRTYTTGDHASTMFVVLSDFNNDTHLDIAVANYGMNNIGIFFGYGNGSFSSQTKISTGSSRPISLAIGDINNDHILDIIATSNGTNSIDIFFGYNDGSFRYQIKYFTGYDSLPYSVAIADFNNDTYQDIAVVNYGTDNIGIFFGNGNESFTIQSIYSTGPQSNPCSIAVDDFNKDGYLDIAVANSGTNNIGVFLSYRNGSFLSKTVYSISSERHPCSIIISDINQDNQLDIAVSNYESNSLSIFIGLGNGNFEAPTTHSTGIDSAPVAIAYGDFDNDNQTDLAVVNFHANNIIVAFQYSIMQSETPLTYTAGVGSLPYRISTGDFDNDNQLDIAVVNSAANNLGIFIGLGNGSFREQTTYSTGNNSHPYALVLYDLDNDYHLDIVVATSNTESLGLFYGYGNGTFATLVTLFTGEFSSPRWVVVADFNNDHIVDIAFADYGTNNVGIFLGHGNRIFKNLTKHSSGNNSHPISMAAGDLNHDNLLDIIVANYGTDNFAVLIALNDGTFSIVEIYSTGSSSLPYMITMTDLNYDKHLDVVVVNSGTDEVSIFYGFGNGSFSKQITYSTGLQSIPLWISIADLNNDNLLDLAIANSNTNNVGVLLGNSNGYFSNQLIFPSGPGSSPKSISLGDFNRDNWLDVAVANYGTNNIAILLGHPNENIKKKLININNTLSSTFPTIFTSSHLDKQQNITIQNRNTKTESLLLGNYYAKFGSRITYSTGSSARPYSFAVGDLNSDARVDISIANSGNQNLGLLLGYDDGYFTKEINYPTGLGSSPQHVLIDDFNSDNRADIAFTNSKNDTITILLGNGDGTFSLEMKYSTNIGSSPSSLVLGDLNNDNHSDLVVVNQGTNTIGVFFGFHYTIFSKQKPCQTGNYSGPTSVTIGDFNNDGYLDLVSALYDTNNVGVFLGLGNGSFSSVMTYSDVPASHSWSVGVGDFNNDTNLDIVLANWGDNSVSLVLGDGNGNFSKPIISATGSGSRPVSIAVGDFNNDEYLDIATANFGGNSISVLFGYGNGSFGSLLIFSAGKGSRPSGIIVADMNHDYQVDIIVANLGIDSVSIFLGYGNGSFAQQLISSTGTSSSPQFAIPGDFNKDGRLDLAVANYGTSSIGILYGYGNGTFSNVQIYSTGIDSHPTNVNIGDFNNDDQLDIIVADEVSNNVGILFGYNDGTFASMSQVPLTQGSLAYSVAVGDLNHDHQLDFVVAVYGDNTIGIFLANGSMPFGGQTILYADEGSRPSSVVLGHFNHDSRLDIAITNSASDNIGIFLGDGNRTFSNMTAFSTGNGSNPSSLAIGDFNNDSLTDIVVANSKTNNIIIFIGYGNGSFFNIVSYPMGENSEPKSISVDDFNRDYQPDIAVANYGTNNICLLFGCGNGTFTNQTWYPSGHNSRPNWITFTDLNNDSWQDIVIAAYGTDNIEVLLNLCEN